MVRRLTFLSHFMMCVGVGVAAFLLTVLGVPQRVWLEDQSMCTSLIALLLLFAMVRLGAVAWHADTPDLHSLCRADASVGHLLERLCVMAGFIGTAVGLSMQAKALAAGSTSFVALSTSLFTTATGGVAAALIAVMTYNAEAGMRRPSR